jgi:hypothetical protein
MLQRVLEQVVHWFHLSAYAHGMQKGATTTLRSSFARASERLLRAGARSADVPRELCVRLCCACRVMCPSCPWNTLRRGGTLCTSLATAYWCIVCQEARHEETGMLRQRKVGGTAEKFRMQSPRPRDLVHDGRSISSRHLCTGMQKTRCQGAPQHANTADNCIQYGNPCLCRTSLKQVFPCVENGLDRWAFLRIPLQALEHKVLKGTQLFHKLCPARTFPWQLCSPRNCAQHVSLAGVGIKCPLASEHLKGDDAECPHIRCGADVVSLLPSLISQDDLRRSIHKCKEQRCLLACKWYNW